MEKSNEITLKDLIKKEAILRLNLFSATSKNSHGNNLKLKK